MTRQYRSREGEATAIDTKTALTTLGSDTAPGALNVPQGVSKLVGIIVAVMGDFAAVGSANAFVRLEGSGLPAGPEVVGVGAVGGNIATGMHGNMVARLIELETPVTPGNEILVFGEMAGVDIGEIAFGVTLVFE